MKNIVLGISSSIAIYKTCDIIQKLKYAGHNITCVMTKNATELIRPRLFEELTGNIVYTDMWTDKKQYNIEHISLANRDLLVIAPATVRIIGSITNGICDDMLSTVALAANPNKTIIAPAMNDKMFIHPAMQRNLQSLYEWNYTIVEPVTKMLACGYEGKGGLAKPNDIVNTILTKIEDLYGC